MPACHPILVYATRGALSCVTADCATEAVLPNSLAYFTVCCLFFLKTSQFQRKPLSRQSLTTLPNHYHCTPNPNRHATSRHRCSVHVTVGPVRTARLFLPLPISDDHANYVVYLSGQRNDHGKDTFNQRSHTEVSNHYQQCTQKRASSNPIPTPNTHSASHRCNSSSNKSQGHIVRG